MNSTQLVQCFKSMKRMQRMSRHRMRIVNRHILRDAYQAGVKARHFLTQSGITRFHDVTEHEVNILRDVVSKLEAERDVKYLFHANPKRWASDPIVVIIIPNYDSFKHEGDEMFERTVPASVTGGKNK